MDKKRYKDEKDKVLEKKFRAEAKQFNDELVRLDTLERIFEYAGKARVYLDGFEDRIIDLGNTNCPVLAFSSEINQREVLGYQIDKAFQRLSDGYQCEIREDYHMFILDNKEIITRLNNELIKIRRIQRKE